MMGDTRHNKEMIDVTTDEHWRKLIMELCYDQIVKNVTPTGLLTNLGSVFSMDEKKTIRSFEKTESPQGAMAKLLNILDEKDCAGKWQIFKQALVEDGYEWIKDFIEGNFICYGNSETWEHLINLFERTLSEKIRPLEILPYMRQEKIISHIDSQEVEQMCRNYGENQAVFGLLTFLPKRKPNSWYPEFMEILFKTGCEETVGEIDPDIYKKLMGKHRLGTCVSKEIANNTDIDSLNEGADKNMDESDIKENYVSGEEDVVKVACDEIDQHNSGAHSGETEHDLEGSWENLEFTEIHLTRQEQSVIHLYELWDMECLKKKHSHMQKDEKPKFEIKIFVENNTKIKSIENELRSKLRSATIYPIYSLKQSFDANVIRFISTDPVSRYVDKKMNCSSTRLVCSWYIDPSDNVVIVYAKFRSDLKFCVETLQKAVQSNSFNVPAKWFGTSEIQQALSDLKAKHGHEVDAWLRSSFLTLHFISTRERAFQFEQDLKSLFVTKFLIVIKEKHFCKELFRSLQNELEEKFHVNLTEDENNISYGWVIKGGTEYVQDVYNKMKALVDDVCTKSQYYQLDFECPDIEMDLKEMATPSCQIAVEDVSQRSHNTTHPRDDILSHRWVLPNGNDIKIVNADYRWLYKDSTLLQITEATDKHLGKHFTFHPDEMTILLYLPKWKGNDGKEKEILKSSLDNLYQGKGLERGSTCISTTYFVQEPRKLGWPAGMFLKQILLSLGRHKVVTPLIIIEPCRKIFEEMSDAIQKYANLIRNQNNIKITVKTRELAKEKCDAIVNSTSGDLYLRQGAVSATILAAAGKDIQKECENIMIRRNRIPLSPTEVEMTKGYNLKCKYVLHGALVSPWNEQTFGKFVESCLRQAEKEGISSIAFPSIGTGRHGYSVKDVARIMFQTVHKFAAERNDGCLKEVAFIMYHKDHKSLQAFQEEEKIQHEAYMKKESREKCPKPAIVQITVTGSSLNLVDQTFRQIEDRIKEKHVKMRIDPLQEPVSQDITRSVESYTEDDLSECAVGFHDMSNSESDNQEKWEPRNMPPAKETLSSRGDEDVEMTEEGCSIKIELIKRNTEGSRSDFVRTLKKYGVNPESIIWCRYTPNEVKVKLARASDGTSLMGALKNETQYKVYKCNVEAVIDNRAKLNMSMNMFLDIEGSYLDLENESGVKVERSKDGIFTIAGDFSEIMAARCILINWKDEYEKRVASETHPTGATGNQTGEESSETVRKDLIPHSESNFMVTEQRQVSIKEDMGLRVHLNTVKTKNFSVKEKEKEETVSGNIEQDSRNSNSTAGESKSVLHNSDSRMDSIKAYDKSRIESVQNEQTRNPNLFDQVEKEYDLHKNTYVPPYQASNADNKLQNCSSDSHMMTTKEGVKVFVYQGNLCYINVDCIVNSSNERMDHASGLAGVISEMAGQEMEKECQRFIKDREFLFPHNTCVTTAGKLSHYQCIVHICSPAWARRKTIEDFKKDLSGVVTNALVAADSRKMGSIAIPAIGSGRRGGPTQLCFPSYVQGVVAFSSRKPWLQEVHFVDRDVHVVDMMKTAFLLHLPEKDTKIKDKLKKIPRKVKEKHISFWRYDEPSGNIQSFEYAKNITVVICDGALFTGYKHKHIQDLAGIDTSFDNSAVVIIENKIFNGSSQSAALCLQRGGNEFHRNYDLLKESQKTVGKVYYSCGDHSLKFGYVLYAIMPAFDDKALNPSAVNKSINQCFSSLLKKADKKKIKHLCMPFLMEDFSDQSLFEICVSNMMREIETFESERKAVHKFLIHIATSKDEKLNQILQANFSNPKSRKKLVHRD